MTTIILASKSPQRKKILKEMLSPFNITFKTIKPDFTEEKNHFYPSRLVLRNSEGKGLSLIEKTNNNSIIIASDTVVSINKKILGKPKTDEEVFSFLRRLSQKTHSVYTGVCLIDKKSEKTYLDYDVSKVTFKRLSESDINWYIKSKEPFGRAGGYAVQGIGELFVKKIEGSYSNIVGLPKKIMWKFFKKVSIY